MREGGVPVVERLYRKMAFAQIASATTVTFCLLIDSFVIGRLLGSTALSAYGLSSPLLQIYAAFGNMLVCGVQVICGKYMGSGDREGMDRCFSTSIAVALILSALALAAVMFGGKALVALLGAGAVSDQNMVARMTLGYLRGYTLGAPFFFLYQIMIPYMQMLGKRRLIYSTVAVMTVTNMVFDFLSVYVFHAGMYGIGLASGLSYLAGVLIPLAYFMLGRERPFHFSGRAVSPCVAQGIFRNGTSMIFSDICFVVSVYLINQILLGAGGANAVAAYSVISTLSNLIFSIGYGTGSVTLTLSSVFYGDKDLSSILALIRKMVPFSLALMACAVLFAGGFAPWLVGLFVGSDAVVSKMASTGLRIYTLGLLPAVLSFNFRSYFQGIRRRGHAYVVAVMRFLFPTILLKWLLSRILGVNGIWIGAVCGETIALIAIAAAAWHSYGHISMSAEAFSFLSPDFDAGGASCLDLKIQNQREVVEASERVSRFCRDRGMEARQTMLLGLCVEEIGVNIIEYGFTGSSRSVRRKYAIDVRVVVEEDRRYLRIRDNCANFDPLKYMDLHRDDDPASHIGLRMVMGLVKEAVYGNSLGLNNLTLTL